MIPLSVPNICGNEWKYVKECLDTSWVSSAGSYVDKFEDDFKSYLGAESAVVTMNGTAALELALRTLGVGKGDEVIVSSMTFVSPINAIKYVGAEPVFIDICRDTWVMDAEKIEEMITSKTKAVIPIHIYGHPVDMDKVMEVARKYNLYVIEDATEALGSEYKGKKVGTIGDVGCFSFNGNKIITTGAGGMLVTNDERLGEKAKYLSTQAKTITTNCGFYHKDVGYNFRMPNILAAMGVAQLENIEQCVIAKREHAKIYNECLKNIKGIALSTEREWAKNVYWLYSILIEDNYGIMRNELIDKLRKNGIQSRPFFLPVHKMIPYSECRCGDMEVTRSISQKGINLPSSVGLRKSDIEFICDLIK